MKEKKEIFESLPAPFRLLAWLIHYNIKETLILLALIFFGLWALTAFHFSCGSVEIHPGIRIEVKKEEL